jgi:primosomal protein N' (replication factor Y)
MFVRVKLLNKFSEPLLYAVPEELAHESLLGRVVQVPLRAQKLSGVVTHLVPHKPADVSFAIKPIAQLEPFPADTHYYSFIKQVSHYYHIDPLYFIQRMRLFLEQTVARKRKSTALSAQLPPPVHLTKAQQEVCTFVGNALDNPAYTPTLLHGVTGSGKTEVYKTLIIKAIEKGSSVILLLPEVTLALRFQQILRDQLPQDLLLFGFHSGTSTADKRALWERLLAGNPTLIIGVHMPVLLPIARLGLIIIDEEHDVGYQEKKHPKMNSKEIALWRAQISGIPILLGSATPSIASLYNVRTKGWHFFQLLERFGGTLPTIETVYLSDKKERRHFWVSKPLEDGIKDRLSRGEQVIIFLNRRGFSFFVQCKACAFIFNCTSCSVSLTLHEDYHLLCHYCGKDVPQPTSCPACKAPENQFLNKGIGTQQLVGILQRLFPQARIGRADMDITAKKKLWKQTIADFSDGKLDILVGTQTITKGFHFPRVTLVGVLWADLQLNFPVYNASETSLQQLIQVAGRAGRAGLRSHVIVQAMAEHPIFNYMHEVNYLSFYEQELASRTAVSYPPVVRFAEIELKSNDEILIDREAGLLVQELCAHQAARGYTVTILGPSKPPIHKIKNSYARKVYIKGASIKEIVELFGAVNQNVYRCKLYFTPNPLR